MGSCRNNLGNQTMYKLLMHIGIGLTCKIILYYLVIRSCSTDANWKYANILKNLHIGIISFCQIMGQLIDEYQTYVNVNIDTRGRIEGKIVVIPFNLHNIDKDHTYVMLHNGVSLP